MRTAQYCTTYVQVSPLRHATVHTIECSSWVMVPLIAYDLSTYVFEPEYVGCWMSGVGLVSREER